MATATASKTVLFGMAYKFDITKTDQLHGVSFSSCLNASDENLVPKSAHTVLNLGFSAEPQEEPLDYHHQLFLGGKEEDGEIGVFQAEKYFNGAMDHHEEHMIPKSKVSVFSNHKKEQEQKPQDGTPSIVSESSANSQSSLLRKIPKTPSSRKPERTRGSCRGFLLAAVGCSICACSDSGSVDEAVPTRSAPLSDQAQAKTKKSLDVLRSPKADSLLFGKRLAMLTSELTTKKEDLDTESDASSDLFEIESLTGKARSNFLTRQTSDATSDGCPAGPATACYAPSETSIQWSVITASAADFSVVSKNNDRDHGQRRRLGGGGALLLGCKSQKAVRVAGDALRSVSGKYQVADQERIDGRMRRGSAALAVRNPVARFQAETRLSGFDLKYGKHGSHLLYVGN